MPKSGLMRTKWIPPRKNAKQDLVLQGHKASLNEYNVALALDELKIKYQFQEAFRGGHRLIGGIVVDFIVETKPLSTPVWVHGEYWHQHERALKDRYQFALLFYLMRGELAKPVILWGGETETVEDAKAAIRRKML